MNAGWFGVAILCGGVGTAAIAQASPLREFGHIAITEDVCANVVVHANSAIAAALRGDDRLARAIAKVRAIDFDDDNPGKRAALMELARLAADIDDATTRGESEVGRLATMAGQGSQGRSATLRIFANSLGSALARQGKMGSDLNDFLGALAARELRGINSSGSEPAQFARQSNGRSLVTLPERAAFEQQPVALDATARSLANDFEKRMQAVADDETRAADRAEAAVTGC